MTRLIDAHALKDTLVIMANKCGGALDILDISDAIEIAPTVERPHGNWEYLKEHITEMRDADGKLNQKQTCQFILNLMDVIEREGDRNVEAADNRKSS